MNISAQRVLIIFQELLKGKRLGVKDVQQILLEKNHPTPDLRTIQSDLRTIQEVCPLVESVREGSPVIYFIRQELRRLNYF